MNGQNLLIGLSYIDRRFIEESENDTVTGKGGAYAEPKQSGKLFRRPLLIAAIIALTLVLVGCAVVYVLNLQDMIVREHTYFTSEYNEDGEKISTEEKSSFLISLQNVHQEALAEWLEFKESYDQDNSLIVANDNNESGVPESYFYVYDCYTWDMVDQLEEIVAKYDLQLLSKDVGLQYYEHSVLFDALKIDSLIEKDAPVNVEYLSSYFYPEGTFHMDLQITPTDDPIYEELFIGMHYSRKEYFDPVVGTLGADLDSYEQWNYTRRDGTELLLVMNADSARIYADLPDAFVSVQMSTASQDVAMTKELLENIAEYFDFSIQPQPADMEEVDQLLEKARTCHEADKAAKKEALYNNGYNAYVEQLLEKAEKSPLLYNVDYMTYALHDVNGDGTEELIVCGYGALYDIISSRDGDSFLYFNADNLPASPVIYICENNVMEIYDSMTGSHYYFKAEAEGASFIVGLYINNNIENSQWGRFSDIPTGDESKWNLEGITEEEVNNIIASHPRVELDWKPISEFPIN